MLVLALFACGSKEARRPVLMKTNTFLKESAMKNKKLVSEQRLLIDSIIKNDTIHTYATSADGFKYYYITENKQETYTPTFGDKVTFSYSLSDIYGKEIYSKQENKVITYYVDKQELFLGLRSAIKMLKVGEEAVFYFPSEIAFGYHGDNDKIGVNKPIVAQIHLYTITKESKEEGNSIQEKM